ncbi:MAG: hypothetical protein BGO55_08265 [Sphingobacteriales bacterium 50-39]|nr:hypothetical protein [Sphingobacteriales bacterium]OJW59257.1 MAG: hypothetical protein BGO55_08265 [Sphingobacteriales bacterium 50-39]
MKLYLILLFCVLSLGAFSQKRAPSAYVKNLMDDTARLGRRIDSLRPLADAAFDEYRKWEDLRGKAQKAKDRLSASDSLHYKQRLESINKVLAFRNRRLKEADARLTPHFGGYGQYDRQKEQVDRAPYGSSEPASIARSMHN